MESKQGAPAGQGPAAQVQAQVVYNDINELDAVEKRTLETARVYLDPEKTTPGNDVLETDEMHTLRFETYDAICRSIPYHRKQIKVCEKGNIHQLVTLCMRNILVTPRTIYTNTCLLLRFSLRPSESVIDLVNKIDGAQQDANMMDNQAFTEELKIGALLNAVAEDNRFKTLAESFSLSSCTLNYKEMCDELIKHELHKAPHTQSRQRQVSYQVTATGLQHMKRLQHCEVVVTAFKWFQSKISLGPLTPLDVDPISGHFFYPLLPSHFQNRHPGSFHF